MKHLYYRAYRKLKGVPCRGEIKEIKENYLLSVTMYKTKSLVERI